MIALTGCTGKLGGATLEAILKHSLTPPSSLVICTSSDPSASRWDDLKAKGAQVRSFNFDSPNPSAFAGCTKLFLVSTPRISLDFLSGEGRETHHIAAIQAAKEAGVQHVYYTSLAFGSKSQAGVMRAHLRTEEFLAGLDGVKSTIIREGLYNESWPLYLGYFDPQRDKREQVILAGDGLVSWTAIRDLGVGTAIVVTDSSDKYDGKTFYLSTSEEARSLKDIAAILSKTKGKDFVVEIVGREEYVNHYVERGLERPNVEWWSTTYAALTANECLIKDQTLKLLLESKGLKPKSVEETVREMLGS